MASYKLRVGSYIEATSYELFLIELQVAKIKLWKCKLLKKCELIFECCELQQVLQVKFRKCVLLEKITSYLGKAI